MLDCPAGVDFHICPCALVALDDTKFVSSEGGHRGALEQQIWGVACHGAFHHVALLPGEALVKNPPCALNWLTSYNEGAPPLLRQLEWSCPQPSPPVSAKASLSSIALVEVKCINLHNNLMHVFVHHILLQCQLGELLFP